MFATLKNRTLIKIFIFSVSIVRSFSYTRDNFFKIDLSSIYRNVLFISRNRHIKENIH